MPYSKGIRDSELIAKRFHYFQLVNLLKKATGIFVSLSLLTVLSTAACFFSTQGKSFPNELAGDPVEYDQIALTKPITLDSLKLNQEFSSLFFHDLQEELSFAGNNTRPDAVGQSVKALVVLIKTQDQKVVCEGEKVYFSYDTYGLRFSKQPTPLWIKIKEIGHQLFCDAKVVVSDDQNNKVYQEATSLCFDKCSLSHELFSHSSYIRSLEIATWLEPDKFIGVYGGEKYHHKKGAYRLYQPENQSYEFVQDGDFVYFHEKVWKLIDQEDVRDYPLAQVKVYSQNKLSLRVWDESGMKESSLMVSCKSQPPLNLRVEEIFSKIRPRTSAQVTCKMGGKTAILKNGDWLIRSSNQWKLLRSSNDLKKYLNYELQGELFVFDEIEKNESNPIFKGHLFDTMRTQMQVVRIPLSLSVKDKNNKKDKLFKKTKSVIEDDIDDSEFENFEEEELLRITTEGRSHETKK